MSVCARLFKQLQTKIWFDDLPRVQKIVLFSTSSSSSVHEKSVALVHAFTLSKSAMKNYTRAKTNMIWEKQNLMTMKMMRWGEKKSDSYIVLLLAVCVSVVCLFRVFRCVSQLSCYRFAQGYIVNWMETSIIVSLNVCANMSVCVSFFSLFFGCAVNFRQNSSGFHSVFIFFSSFFLLLFRNKTQKKILCPQYDYTLYSHIW